MQTTELWSQCLENFLGPHGSESASVEPQIGTKSRTGRAGSLNYVSSRLDAEFFTVQAAMKFSQGFTFDLTYSFSSQSH